MRLIASGIDAWRHMGDRFSGENLQVQTSDIVGFVLLVAGLVAGYWLLVALSKWQKHRNGRSDRPRSPFIALSRAHGLSRKERGVCQQVATELGLADPAELFVRPEIARTKLANVDARLAERMFC